LREAGCLVWHGHPITNRGLLLAGGRCRSGLEEMGLPTSQLSAVGSHRSRDEKGMAACLVRGGWASNSPPVSKKASEG